MYLKFFGFKAKPFQITTDPKFLWLGEQHREALAVLKYGVHGDKGIVALSGDVGTGKTTLIHALINEVKNDVIAAIVSDPGLKPHDFFYYIATLYGIKNDFKSKGEFLVLFRAFLENAYNQNKKVLLIIDEAQRLSSNMLEEIRLLSNLDSMGEQLLNVFLVGQNELNDLLIDPDNKNLKQRIAIHFNILPLTEAEVIKYVSYRLLVAGCERQLFTDTAVKGIYAFSKGYPRLINIICDHSLITAFVEDSQTVTADTVVRSAKELRVPFEATSKSIRSNIIAESITDEKESTTDEKGDLSQAESIKPYSRKKWNPFSHQNPKSRFPLHRRVFSGLAIAIIILTGYLFYQSKFVSHQLTPITNPSTSRGDNNASDPHKNIGLNYPAKDENAHNNVTDQLEREQALDPSPVDIHKSPADHTKGKDSALASEPSTQHQTSQTTSAPKPRAAKPRSTTVEKQSESRVVHPTAIPQANEDGGPQPEKKIMQPTDNVIKTIPSKPPPEAVSMPTHTPNEINKSHKIESQIIPEPPPLVSQETPVKPKEVKDEPQKAVTAATESPRSETVKSVLNSSLPTQPVRQPIAKNDTEKRKDLKDEEVSGFQLEQPASPKVEVDDSINQKVSSHITQPESADRLETVGKIQQNETNKQASVKVPAKQENGDSALATKKSNLTDSSSETFPPALQSEKDPSAIIDWLLQKKE